MPVEQAQEFGTTITAKSDDASAHG
jgi:hypothetical protein